MKDEILYMLSIVAVGFLVNYGLRSLPFVLFAGRSRTLPPWVDKFGRVISPIIIAALVVYSFAGLAWKSASPYLAAAVTVGLHLWRRNALLSILAGTALYMSLMFFSGCASRPPMQIDARDPSVRVTASGIMLGEQKVDPATLPELLADYEITKSETIHVRVEKDVKDLSGSRRLIEVLRRAGYANVILVTERHAESFVTKTPPRSKRPVEREQRRIRYRKADE